MADAQMMPKASLPSRTRTSRRAGLIFLLILVALAGPALSGDGKPLTIQEWSKQVWEAALTNRDLLEDRLNQLPDARENEQAKRLRADIDQHNTHAKAAVLQRDEARA